MCAAGDCPRTGEALREPGRYSDGDGLHLFISRTGGKSWVHRVTVDGRRRDIGLGGYPTVSLAQARNRAAIADGKDPLAEKRRPAVPTFREAAHATHDANRPRWRNRRHALSWIQTLERHAFPRIGNMPVDTIGRTDVLAVLTPIWTTRPETARRVRQRMRTVFRWTMAHEAIESNPAGEAIDGALPSMPKVKAHLRALPYHETGEALRTVDASPASPASKLCLRFLVLTAARSGEARGSCLGRDGPRRRHLDSTRLTHEVGHGAPRAPQRSGAGGAGGGRTTSGAARRSVSRPRCDRAAC